MNALGCDFKIPLSDPYNNYSIDTSEVETFTQDRWGNLIGSALKSAIPYYILGINVCKSGKLSFYDGISLIKQQKANPSKQDVSNRTEIDKTFYLFLKTFDLNKDGTQKPIPLDKLSFSESVIKNLNTDLLNDISITAMDLPVYLSSDAKRKRIGECQFIFAVNLIGSEDPEIHLEGLRWLTCSSKNECSAAQEYLPGELELDSSDEEDC